MARHVRNKKKNRHGTAFWDSEYTKAEHLALSTEASEDLEKFCRYLTRETKGSILNPLSSAVDFGCGNGRNLVYLSRNFGVRGVGYDSSAAAIREARLLSQELPLTYEVRSIAGAFENLGSETQMLALDMMSSHFLKENERSVLRDEIHRVLKPGGYLFMKTFLLDGDLHSKRLMEENPAEEDNSYIHPVIGVQEHVYGEEELINFLEEKFIVHRTYASHKHVSRGKARKRRTIAVYAQKDPYAK